MTMAKMNWQLAARRDRCRGLVPAAPTHTQLAVLAYVRSYVGPSNFLTDLRRDAEHSASWIPTKAQAKVAMRIKQERTGCRFPAPIGSLAERRAHRLAVLAEVSPATELAPCEPSECIGSVA